VGGLVAFGAYKMSKRDADRVKEHTGTDPEDMTDEELEQAMDELDIEKDLRTAADQEQASGGDSLSNQLDAIERLAGLRDSGALTDEEFQQKKRQILGLD